MRLSPTIRWCSNRAGRITRCDGSSRSLNTDIDVDHVGGGIDGVESVRQSAASNDTVTAGYRAAMLSSAVGSRALATIAILTVGAAACADENSAPDVTIDNSKLSPATSATDGSVPTAAGARYVVVAGDSLSAIADRHCVSTSDLVIANGWDDGIAHPIFPGDAVALPSQRVRRGWPPGWSGTDDL